MAQPFALRKRFWPRSDKNPEFGIFFRQFILTPLSRSLPVLWIYNSSRTVES